MKGKIIFLIIVAVIIILCIIGVACNKGSKNDGNTLSNTTSENIVQNITEENVVEENIIEENKVEENVIETENDNTVQDAVSTTTIYEKNPEIGTTDKKQEAINLVKDKWGEDDTVEFRCDDITDDGIYIIAAVSKETAQVRNFFRVNLENKLVEVDY